MWSINLIILKSRRIFELMDIVNILQENMKVKVCGFWVDNLADVHVETDLKFPTEQFFCFSSTFLNRKLYVLVVLS